MKIALIGYGKMGHAIEAMATGRGHTVACRIDRDDPWPGQMDADVAIEFTTPATAVANIRRCWAAGLPVVCGTTGWDAERPAVEAECRAGGHTLFAASNFSIGMNIMFALNRRLAELMKGRTDYTVGISETHHIHKLDAPSGTAITLQEQIVECGARSVEDVPIASYREGEVPGTHTVVYDSEIDTLTLTHEAHSRKGLAQGALLAAEFLASAQPGVYTMKDIL
jgi:4-hydroxy-tetrahydrodipicolinate reductase